MTAGSRPILTPECFAATHAQLPATGARAVLRVEHRWLHPDGTVERHHQLFGADHVLTAWRPGPCEPHDLRIVGPAPAAETLAAGRLHDDDARYVLGDDVERDALGLPLTPWSYDGLDPSALRCRALIVCGAGPDGPLVRVLSSEHRRLAVGPPGPESLTVRDGVVRTRFDPKREFRVNAPYDALVRWLHSDTLLGHLISAGFEVVGDLWRVSAIEGLLDGSRDAYACDEAASGVLVRYAACRLEPRTSAAIACGIDRVILR